MNNTKYLNQVIKVIKADTNSTQNWIISRTYKLEEELEILKEISKRHFNTNYDFDAQNIDVIKRLIKYFNDDRKFESGNQKLTKGILIAGKVGCGKSLLMKIFKLYCFYLNLKHQYRIVNVDVLTDLYMNEGSKGIDLYVNNFSDTGCFIPQSNPIQLYIDDFGTEKKTTKHYGTDENVIDMIINQRYDLYQNDKRIITHASTNLNPKSLKDRYGARIYSRICEMFNYIHLQGNDRRR